MNTSMKAMHKELNYIDCHTHILPGMDDGSQSLQESILMLKSLLSQGVHTVWLTPHFYPYKETIESFLSRREKACAILKPDADELGIEVLPASETFLSDCIFNAPSISKLCIGGKYLLTELPFSSSFSQQTLDRISRLAATYSVIPILAHVERYPKLIKDVAMLDEFIDMGCLAQINLSSLEDGIIKRKQLLQYIETNLVHLAGTDCHNMENRSPKYSSGISIIEKRLGYEYVDKVGGVDIDVTDAEINVANSYIHEINDLKGLPMDCNGQAIL